MRKLRPKRPPTSLYTLSYPGWNYDPSGVFQSRAAAIAERDYAKDVYGEKLTLRHYKLQPKGTK